MTPQEMEQRLRNGEQLELTAQDMAALVRHTDEQELQRGRQAAADMAEPLNAEQVQHLLCRYANNRTRWGFFVELASTRTMTADAYMAGLRDAYTMGEPHNRWEALRCFYAAPDRRALCDEGGREVLDTLPARFRIFRGCSITEYEQQVYGSSWTLDKARAEWFAWRFDAKDKSRCVVSCEIGKEQVLAVFMGRQEDEVVADIMGAAAGVVLEATEPTDEPESSRDE